MTAPERTERARSGAARRRAHPGQSKPPRAALPRREAMCPFPPTQCFVAPPVLCVRAKGGRDGHRPMRRYAPVVSRGIISHLPSRFTPGQSGAKWLDEADDSAAAPPRIRARSHNSASRVRGMKGRMRISPWHRTKPYRIRGSAPAWRGGRSRTPDTPRSACVLDIGATSPTQPGTPRRRTQ
ncbi:MAG: hypothetical protein JWP03_3740 [Phycisphaerales bacterium]|nr:hypothetical protein [Phycisphaerales bacterium]